MARGRKDTGGAWTPAWALSETDDQYDVRVTAFRTEAEARDEMDRRYRRALEDAGGERNAYMHEARRDEAIVMRTPGELLVWRMHRLAPETPEAPGDNDTTRETRTTDTTNSTNTTRT